MNPNYQEVRPAPDHSHPEELRFFQGAAVGVVQTEAKEAGEDVTVLKR